MPVYRHHNKGWRVTVFHKGKRHDRVIHGAVELAEAKEEELRATLERADPSGPAKVAVDARHVPGRKVSAVIYFVQAASGPIKVGRANDAESCEKRVLSLQAGHYETLVLLATVPASRSLEIELHRLFVADRIRGEWFRPSQELLKFISQHTVRPR
jgi:Meiotically Up-regulated Gene 113 (MUG113) protein